MEESEKKGAYKGRCEEPRWTIKKVDYENLKKGASVIRNQLEYRVGVDSQAFGQPSDRGGEV